jgi:NAD(P)-dependent dehydrogenase (short-subunit alcohol dehydrogenase family)
MEEFRGRVAVITGGASGIGLAIAHLLAHEGVRLALADTDQAALDRAVGELEAAGADVIGLRADVGDRSSVEQLAEDVWTHFGATHLLFNNAGVAVWGPIDELKHSDWEWSLRVNLWGAIHGVEVFLPRLLAQDEEAHIVNTSSFAGLVTSRYMAAYNVAKAGVVALTESLHKDLRDTPISVSVLCPMRVITNVWDTSAHNRPEELGGEAAFRRRPPEETETMAGTILDANYVAKAVLDGVRQKALYIIPHDEAQPILRRRFEKIDAAFSSRDS